MILGSCRAYRPFLSSNNNMIVSNIFPQVNLVYPRCGFFHSLNEIAQFIAISKNNSLKNFKEYIDFLFRAEPVHTTPLNEFDFSIYDNVDVGLSWDDIDALLIEVSSLDCFKVSPENIYLHWNPNKLINASYSEIYPDGFYDKFFPDLGVKKETMGINDLKEKLIFIKSVIKDKKIFITSHIPDANHKNRSILFASLKEAAKNIDDVYFIDFTDVFMRYGYKVNNGIKDIHHLPIEGELALGNLYQNRIIMEFMNDK